MLHLVLIGCFLGLLFVVLFAAGAAYIRGASRSFTRELADLVVAQMEQQSQSSNTRDDVSVVSEEPAQLRDDDPPAPAVPDKAQGDVDTLAL